MVNNAF